MKEKMEVCQVCGLPKEICVCEEIAKEKEKIRVSIDRRRFGKLITVVEGFDKNVKIDMLAKELKQKLACGGTIKKGKIELQGDHRQKVKQILMKMNYAEDQIDVC